MSVQLTLAIIKPDAVSKKLEGKIIDRILNEGFEIRALKKIRLTKLQAEGFYQEHKDKPFFSSLISFMTEGPIYVLALASNNAVERWREVIGATNPENAKEGTIRAQFGTNIERNAVHGSADLESAKREVAFFFSNIEFV